MTVVLENALPFNSTSFQATPFATAFTCSGIDRLLLAWITHNNSSNDGTGFLYNGVAATQYNGPTGYVNSTARAQLWYLINPASGSNNFSLAYSGSATHRVNLACLSGCHQVTPFGTDASDITTNGSGSTLGAVASAVGALVMSFVALGNSGKSITSTGTSQTNAYAPGTDVDGNLDSALCSQPGAASVVASWTWAGTQRAVCLALPIVAAPAPGGYRRSDGGILVPSRNALHRAANW